MKWLIPAVLCLLSFPAMAQVKLKASLSCTAPATHCLIATWTAPAAQPGVTISGYGIYRATTSHGYTLGSPLATVGAGILTYEDDTPTPGTTYFYALTTDCTQCTGSKESTFSPEASGAIATSPVPPPSLTVTPF